MEADTELKKLIIREFLAALREENWAGALTIIEAGNKLKNGDGINAMKDELMELEKIKLKYSDC
jgi:hypothetical protein